MSYKTITHPKGHIEKIYIDDNPRPEVARRIVSLALLEDELPDAVLVQLETIKANTEEVDAKRAAVTRVLNGMARGDKVNILNGKFSTLMTRLVNNTSLTAEQAAAIIDKLNNS